MIWLLVTEFTYGWTSGIIFTAGANISSPRKPGALPPLYPVGIKELLSWF